MDAMLGVGLLGATALLFAWAYGQFRRPQPGAWTRGNFAAATVTLTMTGLFAFALLFVGNFLLTIGDENRWLEIAAATGGAVVLCWFLVPRLMAPALQQADASAASAPTVAGSLPEPANDPHPTSPTGPTQSGRPGGKPGKRRAA